MKLETGNWKLGMHLTVIGIGGFYRRDDAIGLKLVEALSCSQGISTDLWEDADVLTLTNNLLDIEGPVLIVDCVDMGKKEGSYHFFSSDNYSLKTNPRSFSNHGSSLAQAITLAKEMGFKSSVSLFGVQPFDLSPDKGLTQKMRDRFPAILTSLKEEIASLLTGSQI